MNKNLFKSSKRTKNVPATNTINDAGGKAYKMEDRLALAQIASTGCLNGTYYKDEQTQLDEVTAIAGRLPGDFLAKVAIYAREKGAMKDMPALLLAVLAGRGDITNLKLAFARCMDNGRMVRNFVQMVRSGKFGRSSLGSAPKKLVQNWLNERDSRKLFGDSVGNDPSMADVIKMVHPSPVTPEKAALYAYMIDKDYKKKDLPQIVKDFESFKAGKTEEVPNVPHQMLTALPLTDKQWKGIAENGGWHFLRMNLNTFVRHNVFSNQKMVQFVANKLADKDEIRKSKAFPYQLLMAYLATDNTVPNEVRNALQDAVETATENVPAIDGKVYIMVDTSGSMQSPVTGNRGSATTNMRCVDVAALIAASIMRKNPNAEVLPFDTTVHKHNLNPRDSIMTNAQKLASYGGGGTNCAIALADLNARKAKGDLIIYVSDNESWVTKEQHHYYGRYAGTDTAKEFAEFKTRNPKAKMVCIDLTPNGTAQAQEDKSIMNIGGFSDSVFEVINNFHRGSLGADNWLSIIDAIKLG